MGVSDWLLAGLLFLSGSIPLGQESRVHSTTSDDILPWPQRLIPYEIDASVSDNVRAPVEKGLRTIWRP